MFFNILKRDLKRKIGMNIIIIIFIIFSTMFIAGSVNNIVASTTALEKSMDKAGLTDGIAIIIGNSPENLDGTIGKCESIKDYKTDRGITIFADNIEVDGTEEKKFDSTTIIIQVPDESEIKYFRSDGSVLGNINQGEIYLTATAMDKNDIKTGDKMTITVGNVSREFTVSGVAKDAITGAKNMSMTRMFISDEDYKKLYDGKSEAGGADITCVYFSTDDFNKTETELQENAPGRLLVFDRATLKLSYIIDTVIAGILLIVSVCLIVIAIIMIRFTIRFSVSEEFREIGVMKAIGIRDSAIRILYISKYFLITVIGAAIGLAASFPFGALLSELGLSAIVVENNDLYIVNIGCAVFTVLLTLLFCYTSTREIRKMSPVDTIRNSQTGERSKRKSPLRLSRTRKGCAVFMAVNDILSSRKQYAIITVVFALFAILVMMMSTLVYTFSNDGLFTYLGAPDTAHLQMSAGYEINDYMLLENGLDILKQDLKEKEEILEENGMPAKCSQEVFISCKLAYNGASKVLYGIYSVGAAMEDYSYYEGSAPQNENEIALANTEARLLGANVGDTIVLTIGDEETSCIVTGLYETLINVGQNCRLYNGIDRSLEKAVGFMNPTISFLDNPDKAEVEKRIERIKELYPDNEVYTKGQSVDAIIGISEIMNTIKTAILIITVIIIILVVVLMEKSGIIKEKSQIALLKAEGFTGGFIYGWHTLRFAIVSAAASVLGMALFMPVNQMISNPLFRKLGVHGPVTYQVPLLEVLVIYPLVIMGVTALTAFVTSTGAGKITATDTANID